jgi:hypothetical protein
MGFAMAWLITNVISSLLLPPLSLLLMFALGIILLYRRSNLPRPESLRDSKIFIREVIGLSWYRLKFAIFETQATEGTYESSRQMG